MASILIVDDDLIFCEALSTTLEEKNYRVMVAHTLARAREVLKKQTLDIVFIDVFLPDGNGLDLLAGLVLLPEAPEAIVVTAQADPEGAETAIAGGAWDYVQKPADLGEIVLMVQRALQAHERKKQMPEMTGSTGIVGSSRSMRMTLLQMFEAAQSDAPVLISGETGTGKELVARAVHNNSRRSQGPFVVVDCGAIAPSLLESELFGNVRGAFTGAVHARHGLVMLANQGTLFLDEVGELALDQQKVFLRLLQERSFRPIGSTEEVQSNFRIVAATNRNLPEMASGGTFRSDLLFRMQGITIDMPPLRSRGKDVFLLVQHALNRTLVQYGMKPKVFSSDALEACSSYSWPGNVRELLHTVEAAVLAAGSETLILLQHLPMHMRTHAARSRMQGRHTDKTPEQAQRAGGPSGAPPSHHTGGKGSGKNNWGAPPLPAPGTASVPRGPGLQTSFRPDNTLPPVQPGAPAGSAAGLPAQAHEQNVTIVPQADASPASLSGTTAAEGSSAPRTPDSWKEFHETELYEHKRRYLLELLAWAQGNVPKAARTAGVSRQRLYALLREHCIIRQWEN